MKNNDWKDRLNIVYSTNPNYGYELNNDDTEQDTLAPQKQNLLIKLDKRHRNGKAVTLVSGFVGSEEELKKLEKTLKIKCGVGGAAKNGEILLQGDFREKVLQLLTNLGYRAKRGN
jgi:translation initiation factor 1